MGCLTCIDLNDGRQECVFSRQSHFRLVMKNVRNTTGMYDQAGWSAISKAGLLGWQNFLYRALIPQISESGMMQGWTRFGQASLLWRHLGYLCPQELPQVCTLHFWSELPWIVLKKTRLKGRVWPKVYYIAMIKLWKHIVTSCTYWMYQEDFATLCTFDYILTFCLVSVILPCNFLPCTCALIDNYCLSSGTCWHISTVLFSVNLSGVVSSESLGILVSHVGDAPNNDGLRHLSRGWKIAVTCGWTSRKPVR